MMKIKSIFVNYLKYILKHSNALFDYYIDVESGHLYFDGNRDCECGIFDNFESKNEKINLDNHGGQNINLLNFNSFLNKKPNVDKVPNLLDCFESKINSLRLVNNLVTTIFQIGVFISD
jgi:hypothetical protein